jgi:hypothetical protein
LRVYARGYYAKNRVAINTNNRNKYKNKSQINAKKRADFKLLSPGCKAVINTARAKYGLSVNGKVCAAPASYIGDRASWCALSNSQRKNIKDKTPQNRARQRATRLVRMNKLTPEERKDLNRVQYVKASQNWWVKHGGGSSTE